MAKPIKTGQYGFSALKNLSVNSQIPLNILQSCEVEIFLFKARLNKTLNKEVKIIRDKIAKLVSNKMAAIKYTFENTPLLPIDEFSSQPKSEIIIAAFREEDKTVFESKNLDLLMAHIQSSNAPIRNLLEMDSPLSKHFLIKGELKRAKVSAFVVMSIGMKRNGLKLMNKRNCHFYRAKNRPKRMLPI